MMPDLSDGDERGEGIADDRQPNPTIEPVRQASQLKRQRRDLSPRDQPGQRTVCEDRHRERVILAISLADRLEPALLVEVRLGSRGRLHC